MKPTFYEIKESDGSLHTIRVDKIDRLQLTEDRLRTLIGNEIQMYHMTSESQAKKVYEEICKIMHKITE